MKYIQNEQKSQSGAAQKCYPEKFVNFNAEFCLVFKEPCEGVLLWEIIHDSVVSSFPKCILYNKCFTDQPAIVHQLFKNVFKINTLNFFHLDSSYVSFSVNQDGQLSHYSHYKL